MFETGEDNPNWKGGVADYPNHGAMKRNRLIKLKQADCKCEVCGEPANGIHHIDGSRDNHALDNLVVLCKKCHWILHTGHRKNTSKYRERYGMTLNEMADTFGGSPARYFTMDKENKLEKWLKNQIK